LILCHEDQVADLRVVKHHLGVQGNLHFASKQSLSDLLGVSPGSVTPLALFRKRESTVRVFIDASFVDTIDKPATPLYFHPLRHELQVSLTLNDLERFLIQGCGVALETIPSLTKYGTKRRYGDLMVTHRRQRSRAFEEEALDNPEGETDQTAHSVSNTDYTSGHSACPTHVNPSNIHTKAGLQTSHDYMHTDSQARNNVTCRTENICQDFENITHLLGFSQQQSQALKAAGITTAISKRNPLSAAATEMSPPQNPPRAIACKCVYMKDKRDNYFLLICHAQQKVDYSALKMQLKPKKKITPLDWDELRDLLNFRGDRVHPFALARVAKPLFLVAVANNLYQIHKVKDVLEFPFGSGDISPSQGRRDLEDFLISFELDRSTGKSHDGATLDLPSSQGRHDLEASTDLASSQVREDLEAPLGSIDLAARKANAKMATNPEFESDFPWTRAKPFTASARISLQCLEKFAKAAGHDMTTVTLKGSLETLEQQRREQLIMDAASQRKQRARSSISLQGDTMLSELDECPTSSEVNHVHEKSIVRKAEPPSPELDAFPTSLENSLVVSPLSGQSVFYQMTSPLRQWLTRVWRWIFSLFRTRALEAIKAWGSREKHEPTAPQLDANEGSLGSPQHSLMSEGWRDGDGEIVLVRAKVERLGELIQLSGLAIKLFHTENPSLSFKADVTESNCYSGVGNDNRMDAADDKVDVEAVVRCRTYLLQEDRGKRLYMVFCPDDSHHSLSKGNLRRLRMTLDAKGALSAAGDSDIDRHLVWRHQHGTVLESWKAAELSPLSLPEVVDPSHVTVAMTTALYAHPDNVLHFHLPSLGVTLTLTADNVEALVEDKGFTVVYLP
jgi:hypothetical protein